MTSRDAIYTDIASERDRQEAKFPGRTCAHEIDNLLKLAILHEESGEVARALLDHESVKQLRAELIQVAAVCVAWVESIDGKTAP